MSLAHEAIKRHGSAVDAVLKEDLGHWPIGQGVELFVALAREVAAAELKRRKPE